MKEKIMEHRKEIMIGASVLAMTILAVCGAKKAYHDGFQWGCDLMFHRISKEFPDLDLNDFWEKYHK